MTIAISTRDFIVADSRISRSLKGVESPSMTAGKIFTRKGGGLFATAGDERRTYHFEKSMIAGREPEPLDELEGEDSEAVVLLPDHQIVYYGNAFCPSLIGEQWMAIGGPVQVAESWLLHDHDPITAIRRCIEVDRTCGYPIVVAYLDGCVELHAEDGSVIMVPKKAKR